MLQPLDGPAVSSSVAVSSAVEIKVGSTVLDERKMLSVQPTDGNIYLSYEAAASASNAFLIVFEGQYIELERGALLPVYMVAESGTVNVLVGEIA
jgi:hypothetical protein